MLKPHDFKSNENKIQVIASFNKNQDIKPLYFKYNDKTITILSCTCEKSHSIYCKVVICFNLFVYVYKSNFMYLHFLQSVVK